MQCPKCQLIWTPPPTTCPKCRNTVPDPTEQTPEPLQTDTPPVERPMIAPTSKWGYDEEIATGPDRPRALKTPMKNTGIFSIIFGGIGVVIGLSALSANSLNIILVFIGLFLIGEGIWLQSTKPSPTTYFIDGIALLLVGGWNILVSILNSSHGGTPLFALLGIWQIVWAFRRFQGMGKV